MKLSFAKTLSSFDGLLSGKINGAKVFIWKKSSLTIYILSCRQDLDIDLTRFSRPILYIYLSQEVHCVEPEFWVHILEPIKNSSVC